MTRVIRLAICSASMIHVAISGFANPAPPTPASSPYSFIFAYGISNNGNTLNVAAGAQTNYNVNVTGLRVNLQCAKKTHFSSLANARTDLLTQGCAKIVGTPLDTAEENAQATAKSDHVGIWAVKPGRNQRTSPGFIARSWHWIEKHKLASISLVLAILAAPLLWKLAAWVAQLFYKRKVNIIIAGVPAAGKTGLWIAWKDEYELGPAGQIKGLAPTVGVRRTGLEPVELRKWTLQPFITDTAGAEPWRVLEGIRRPRGLRGAILQRRTKRVLVYVVAPCPQEEVASGDPFDTDYIKTQFGYTSLPVAIIGQGDPRIKPNMVIMFATKFDLVSPASVQESDGTAASKVAVAFQQHREFVESACRQANIPFTWLVGSAVRGWNIAQLRKILAGVVK